MHFRGENRAMSANTLAPPASSFDAPPEVRQSIERIIPVLMQYTPEEIDGMCARLAALLERRQPPAPPAARGEA